MRHHRSKLRALLTIAVALLLVRVYAHNTNTSHTRITEAAIRSIIAADDGRSDEMQKSAYAELYATDGTDKRINWGNDPRYELDESVDKSLSEFIAPYTVMDGVVLEDDPFMRVFSHFYHGYSGAGSNDFLNYLVVESAPSAVVAHRYFDQAIEVYGYQDEEATAEVPYLPPGPPGSPPPAPVFLPTRAAPAMEMGFFLFGHALHHMEDASSIAHSQNDAHVTLGDAPGGHFVNEAVDFIGSGEADDYESSYIPTRLWTANAGDVLGANPLDQRFFGPPGGGIWTPIEFDHFDAIWSPPRSAGLPLELGPVAGADLVDPSIGLSRSVVNATLFQGDFGIPPAVGCAESHTTGEMAKMFNTDGAATCTIYFELDSMSQFIGHRIDGTTPEQHIGWWLFLDVLYDPRIPNGTIFQHKSAWWPMSSVGGPTPPAGIGGDYHYIEQIMVGVDGGTAFNPNLLIRPNARRPNLQTPWDPVSNDVMPAQVVVDEFGVSAPRSLAEHFSESLVPLATRYAAGFAQLWYDFVNTPPYIEKLQVKQGDQTRYSAEWLDISRTRSINFYDEYFLYDTPKVFNYVVERNLVIDTLKHIDPEKPFEIIIEFNEPVQDVGDDKIAVWLNDMAITYAAGNMVVTPPSVPTKWESNREWTLKVPDLAAVLPGGSDIPEGEVTVTVQAYDRNFHRTSSGAARTFGARLDENPGTPARRQRLNPDEPRDQQVEDRLLWGVHSWHDANSVDVNFPGMEPGDFAYDRTPLNQPVTGDSTHVLLFDIEPPEAALDVQK